MSLMDIKHLAIIFMACTIPVNAQTPDEPVIGRTGTLRIYITGFKNDEGIARIALFRGEKGFPDDIRKSYWIGANKIKNRESILYISAVDYGTYAASVYHDANSNEKIDKIWRIIPKEGFGTSNNTREEKQGPSFKESLFEVRADSTYITIEIEYLFGR